jgi:hypothetical protein
MTFKEVEAVTDGLSSKETEADAEIEQICCG